MAKLSVIIPACNAGGCIARSVGSVLSSTFTDLELIVVDDGSKDNTGEICRNIAALDSRLRYIYQDNAGVSAARNRGIAEAQGEFIAFVDADDLIECTAYGDAFEMMAEMGCDSAAWGYYEEYPDGARIAKSAPMATGVYDHTAVQKGIVLPLLQDRLSQNLLLGTVWRYIFRSDIVKNIKFSGAYLEDEVFLIEYFSHPTRMAVLDRPLYGYLQNPLSVTKRYLGGFVDTFLRTLDMKRELIGRFDIPVSPEWLHNSAWAGLLIAVSNEYAPGNPHGGAARVREIAAMPIFADAVANYRPVGMNRNKTLVAKLLCCRQYALLGLLYRVKNRGRK